MTASDEGFDDMSTNLPSAESSGELGRLTNPLAPVRKTSMLRMIWLNQCTAESKEYRWVIILWYCNHPFIYLIEL